MTDLEMAVQNLTGHTLCLCRGGMFIFSEKRGIAPMMDLIASKTDVTGYAAADLIVGKAAALLFVYAGIREVYAQVISEGAVRILKKYDIPFRFNMRTKQIVNRKGDDICPMEKAVQDIDEPEQALTALTNAIRNIT